MNAVMMENELGGFTARNEPLLSYPPGSAERTNLERVLDRMAGERLDMPTVIGGREVRTGGRLA